MKKNQTIAFVIFILIHISILSYFHNRFWCAADDGEFSHVAQRLNNGEVLFRAETHNVEMAIGELGRFERHVLPTIEL